MPASLVVKNGSKIRAFVCASIPIPVSVTANIERSEIKDLISYLTVSLNPDDSVHLLRVINVPPRGGGKTTTDPLEELAVERATSIWGAIEIAIQEARLPMRTIRALEAFRTMTAEFVQAAEELSNSALLEKIIHGTKYVEMLQEEGTEESESRIENIRELLTAAEESHKRGEKLRDFLDHAALVSDQDAYDEASPQNSRLYKSFWFLKGFLATDCADYADWQGFIGVLFPCQSA